jgi:hypothetical protein
MFPIIPIACLVSVVGGGGVLAWYSSLNKREREDADAHANDYAARFFEKQLDNLNRDEAHRVIDMTRRHFG